MTQSVVYIDLDDGGELVLTTDADGIPRDPSGSAWGTDCDRVYDPRPGAWLRLDGDMIRGVEYKPLGPHEWPGDAIISPCRLYRYQLWRERTGAAPGPWLAFAMLNPSKAHGKRNDPTIRKCQGFAERIGFDRFIVVNAYAYRATEPADLYAAMRSRPLVEVVGPENTVSIFDAFSKASRIVAAWGANKVFGRARVMQDEARRLGKSLEAIAITQKGAPQHPLMARYVDTLVPFEVAP